MDIIASFAAVVAAFFKLQIWWVVGLGIVCAAPMIFRSHACHPGQAWWRSPTLLGDIAFSFLNFVVQPYLRIFLALLIVFATTMDFGPEQARAFFEEGAGPLSSAPVVVQLVVYVVGGDFMLYWAHRFFHGRRLWAFHAVHHAPEQLDWTVMYRFHPVNMLFSTSLMTVTMLWLGVPPWLMAALAPIDTVTAAWVHSNLNWSCGPLKRIIATPVFHRWHHTGPDEGGSSNFAPTFAFWDVLFGTYYMPEGKLPQTYGVDDPSFPRGFAGQLFEPFIRF
ncbi:MAG TPA: sterol desaturase family protein, partial [Beijerinckiaceae bacterium]